ncbi:hypothetical protein LOTGIDRAFT_171695 [Lottia gigantea]|uniref:PARP n=1 Tax=Lottia gigantea TaxID=225164 RepID=V4CLN0_LOTGI|nr:hypothetical protein LOTGIDRAFT_171695 [Lottia gigantea]ESP03210.1 hypothetical protein LOTGIDRAFT_171695 [Lottia gigantea]
MADGPSVAKKAKVLPECPYGVNCYRKNPQHLKDFSHNSPSVASTSRDSNGVSASSSTSATLPPCKYGAKCYRKNLMHFAEFSHPTKTSNKDDSGSDTDIVDSDEEDKTKQKKDGNDILSRGMSLVKSYSQMSEEERKELIKKAFEAKQKLQEELEVTKKQVAEKAKEVDKLQAQVTTCLLLVEGEKEAMEGKTLKLFTLAAERDHKEGSADQIHFRLAESQFYRLLSGMDAKYSIDKVEYVVNPVLVKRFQESRNDLKKARGESLSYPVLAFHGTKKENIIKICTDGFKAPGESGFHMRTDTGWYGAGVYFSEYPHYSMSYIQGATKLLLCQVLPGKAYKCTKLIHGSTLMSGHDSHTSPDNKELVIFNSHHILPCYIVHYKAGGGEFKYKPKVLKTEFKDGDLADKYKKCEKAKPSMILKGTMFQFSGKFTATQANLIALTMKHGAGKPTFHLFTHLVATPDEVSNNTNAKVYKATERGASFLILKHRFP